EASHFGDIEAAATLFLYVEVATSVALKGALEVATSSKPVVKMWLFLSTKRAHPFQFLSAEPISADLIIMDILPDQLFDFNLIYWNKHP
ncbi:823_t:CDS:2, partial [Dentiscutata erythropus]